MGAWPNSKKIKDAYNILQKHDMIKSFSDSEIRAEYVRRFVVGKTSENTIERLPDIQLARINMFLAKQKPRLENKMIVSTNDPDIWNHPWFKHVNENPQLHHPEAKEYNENNSTNLI